MISSWDASHGPARPWRAARWSLELRDDELADIAFDGAVIVRAIRAVVRDRDWNTAATVVAGVDGEGGELELSLRFEGFGSPFTGRLHVVAEAESIRVDLELKAAADYLTNRSGLVVLLPPALAGAGLHILHQAGDDQTRFPLEISPHQPARDIAGLAWRHRGLDLRLRLAGDVFEMEDQRNWTDASFKIYNRPLELPFPYPIHVGDRIDQSLRLDVVTASPGSDDPHPGSRIVLRSVGLPFPAIGVAASTAPDPAPAVPTNADTVLVELDLATPNWAAALHRAAVAGVPLDVRIVLDEQHPGKLEDAARRLAALSVARVSAFCSDGPARHVSDGFAIDRLRTALESAGVDAPIVGGARSHFTELNREQGRLPPGIEGVVFSITPLFHASSTEQLVESVSMQRLVAEQAVRIAAGRAVHIGPISLRPHFNNVATSPQPIPKHDDLRVGYGPELLDACDARQGAPELAAWTIASAAALAVPGVETLTYFEEWGPRGLYDEHGVARPAAAAVAALRALSGRELLTGTSPDGLVWSVGADGDRMDLLLANLDRMERSVTVLVGRSERTFSVPALSFMQFSSTSGLIGPE